MGRLQNWLADFNFGKLLILATLAATIILASLSLLDKPRYADYYSLSIDRYTTGEKVTLRGIAYRHEIQASGWFLLRDNQETSIEALVHGDMTLPVNGQEVVVSGVVSFATEEQAGQVRLLHARMSYVKITSWRPISSGWLTPLRKWLAR